MKSSTALRVIPLMAAAAIIAPFVSIASPAQADASPTPARFNVQSTQVTLAQVSASTPYVAWTVPDCVTEIGYLVDGGQGGGSRPVGTAQHADGGKSAVRGGTLTVTAGEQLRLYPASAGVGGLLNGGTGDAGGGGPIGYAAGGGGTGTDSGNIFGIRGNPGGGGGAASAIATTAGPLVVAAGGGGAGGSSWSGTQQGTPGGAGDADGSDGVGTTGTKGLSGALSTAPGGNATNPSGATTQGGGGGGGGGGYRGGSGGAGGSNSGVGGGSGGGGASYLEPSRQGTGTLADYGLSTSTVDPTGDGSVTVAWYGCASVLTVDGTSIDTAGTSAPAAGWTYTTAVSTPGAVNATTAVTDATGRADTTVRGYRSSTDALTVTVTQPKRSGWPIDNWNTPGGANAVCTLQGPSPAPVAVTDVGTDSFSLTLTAGQWVRCAVTNVEAAPGMSVTKVAAGLAGGLPVLTPDAAPDVTSGTAVTWTYTVTNTGNIPLDSVQLADDRLGPVRCPTTRLLPGADTTCTATGAVTAQ